VTVRRQQCASDKEVEGSGVAVPDTAPRMVLGNECCNKVSYATVHRRWAIVLAALAALLWQSLAVQTHMHAPPVRAAFAHGTDAVAASPSRSDDPNGCPFCRQAARAGHYLTPGTLALSIGAVLAVTPRLLHLPRWPRRHAPHGWYGRGPPAPLLHAHL